MSLAVILQDQQPLCDCAGGCSRGKCAIITFCWHVLKPGTPEHRNTQNTGTLWSTGTAEKPQNAESQLTVLFCFPITDHVKTDEMSV